jgi:phage protein D
MAAPALSYAPDFRITINGAPAPAEFRATVTSVRYEDGRNAADRVEIALANPDLYWLRQHIRGMGFALFPAPPLPTPPGLSVSPTPEGLLDIDNVLTLSMGYTGEGLQHMFSGEITGVSATFPNGGMPTLTIVAHDKLNRLAQGKATRGFGLLPDFLIAMLLSAENLIIPLIDPAIVATSTAMSVLKATFVGKLGRSQDASDLDFLASIAKDYDADFWVEDDVLYLSRFIKEYTPSSTLTWRKSLLDFSPRLTTVGQVAGVSMKFTLREIPLDFLVSVYWDFDHERLGVTVLPGVAAKAGMPFAGANFSIVDQPISSPVDLGNSAFRIVSELRSRLNKRLTGSGSCVGDPSVRAGTLVQLDGMGPDFSGDYRVSSATHTIDTSGYQTKFEAFRELIP